MFVCVEGGSMLPAVRFHSLTGANMLLLARMLFGSPHHRHADFSLRLFRLHTWHKEAEE